MPIFRGKTEHISKKISNIFAKGSIKMLTDYADYLTPYEAADEFGISLTTVYNLLRAKKIPGFKIGKSWRIPKDAKLCFIARRFSKNIIKTK